MNKTDKVRVLFVSSGTKGKLASYVQEQSDSLKRKGIDLEYFLIREKGIIGYMKTFPRLLSEINKYNPDIIHAHYGLSGLLANLQRKIPVITTYHGSDINNKKILKLSRFSIRLSKFNIFVSQKSIDMTFPGKNYALIPCGVEINIFKPMDKTTCRRHLNLPEKSKLVLFAGAFENKVKNAQLAQQVVSSFSGDVSLIELNGYGREQVSQLINAADVLLMTSFSEGSPQIIKEAMACNCPIVSVDVGDVQETTNGVEGCFITDYEVGNLKSALQKTLDYNQPTTGRKRLLELGLDSETISNRIYNVYHSVIGSHR